MAADSSCWAGDSEVAKIKKIFRIKKGLVGCAGTIPHMLKFVNWIKEGALEDEFPVGNFEAIIVDQKERITMWDGNAYCPIKIKGYCAVGAGSDIALGALFAGAAAPTAVRAAIKHNSKCRGPVSVYTL